MPSLRDLQQAFSESLFAEADTGFAGHVTENGLPATRRVQVYRNNMLASLTEALGAVFPVVRRLVGDDFFGHAARSYVRAFPSRSGNLHDFGAQFAGFLENFPAAADLVYLGDVARLEWGYHTVFHAADHPPLSMESLATVPANRHADIRFTLNPACRLLSSTFPVLRIWKVNQDDFSSDATVDLDEGGVRLLISRRGLDIEFQPLADAEYAFLEALGEGATFGKAHERALAFADDFDLPGILQRHVAGRTIVDFSIAADT